MLAAISQGSLRALSVERVGAEIVIHAEADASFDALSLGLTDFQPLARRRFSLRSAAWGAALLCCGVVVGLGARYAVPDSPQGAAAAPSPVPLATLDRGSIREQQLADAAKLAQPSAAPELAPAASATAMLAAAPLRKQEVESKAKLSRRARLAARTPAAPNGASGSAVTNGNRDPLSVFGSRL
jgi:hypothetical protein